MQLYPLRDDAGFQKQCSGRRSATSFLKNLWRVPLLPAHLALSLKQRMQIWPEPDLHISAETLDFVVSLYF